MASNSGMGGAHYGLIVAVMLVLILGFTTYMGFKEQQELRDAAVAARAEATTNDTAMKTALEDIEALKKLIGHELDEVGVGDLENNTKVLGAMTDDIKRYGGTVAQATYAATIAELRTRLDAVTAERDQLNQDVKTVEAQMLALNGQYNSRVAVHDKAAKDSQADLQTRITTFEEGIRTKDGEISQLRSNYNASQLEVEQLKEAKDLQKKEMQDEISALSNINDKIREKLDSITEVSFEKEDGMIRWVDNASGLVWINLGKLDNLPKQTTFSVYNKNNEGVGRSKADIKGKIEITRVIGPHLSEARVLQDDLYRPMTPGDVIYTPLWEPGRKEYFSFVGTIDLDDDGQSDRELLHDIVKAAGAEIDNEVNDDGELVDREGKPLADQEPKITVNTKFLVIGGIPDPASFPPDSPEVERIQKIVRMRKEMVDAARKQGIRWMNLTDFLSYIGYEPKRRLYIPGLTEKPFNLKAGAHSTAVNEPILDREAAGKVSDVFTKDRLGQRTSSGQTSKTYGN